MVERQWKYCIIDGLAVQRWGEPRTTLDADITLLTGWGEEERYVSVILDQFKSRIADGKEFGLSRRVLVIRATNGKHVDITLGPLRFEAEMVRRSISGEFVPRWTLPCGTAEDLFIMKVFAGRSRDWLDAESIVVRQRVLDADYILRHLADLCEFRRDSESVERMK